MVARRSPAFSDAAPYVLLPLEATVDLVLRSLVFDEAGIALQVSHISKKGGKYRYYVSTNPILS